MKCTVERGDRRYEMLPEWEQYLTSNWRRTYIEVVDDLKYLFEQGFCRPSEIVDIQFVDDE